jgi:hypothetical protein
VLEGKVAATQKEAAATPSDLITCLTRGQTDGFLTEEEARICGFRAETVSGQPLREAHRSAKIAHLSRAGLRGSHGNPRKRCRPPDKRCRFQSSKASRQSDPLWRPVRSLPSSRSILISFARLSWRSRGIVAVRSLHVRVLL